MQNGHISVLPLKSRPGCYTMLCLMNENDLSMTMPTLKLILVSH